VGDGRSAKAALANSRCLSGMRGFSATPRRQARSAITQKKRVGIRRPADAHPVRDTCLGLGRRRPKDYGASGIAACRQARRNTIDFGAGSDSLSVRAIAIRSRGSARPIRRLRLLSARMPHHCPFRGNPATDQSRPAAHRAELHGYDEHHDNCQRDRQRRTSCDFRTDRPLSSWNRHGKGAAAAIALPAG
jgi:hypothetical protein